MPVRLLRPRPRSYRGYYEQLAFSYSEHSISVGEVIDMLASADGNTFTGYKGGKFIMGPETPIWVSNYGECWDTAVVDVEEHGDLVVLRTGIVP